MSTNFLLDHGTDPHEWTKLNVKSVKTESIIMGEPETLFESDLSDYSTDPSGGWYLFTNGVETGDDGVVTYNSVDGYLDITSVPFTKLWTPTVNDPLGGLDHVKYLSYSKNVIPLTDDGKEVCYSATVSAVQTLGVIPASLLPGITDPRSDLRLAGSAVNSIDFETWMVFDIFLTNDTIYGFYERLPFGRPSFGGSGPIEYHAYSHCFPLARRNEVDGLLNDYNEVSICVNKGKDYVRYLVNGQEKFRVNGIGLAIEHKYRILDHGGIPEKVASQMNNWNVGFGNFTLLDMANPCTSRDDPAVYMTMVGAGNQNANAQLLQLGIPIQYVDPDKKNNTNGDSIPATFLSVTSADRLFGNGSHMRIKEVKVVKRIEPVS